MTTSIGVDFSGAKNEGKTWVAFARLEHGTDLLFDRVQPFRRDDLYDYLATDVATPAVVALDFPFSLPAPFLNSLKICADRMDDVWPVTHRMSLEAYRDQCKNHGTHPMRTADDCHPVSLSALNTRLVPMTYYGMQMLHKLATTRPKRWWIPPLNCGTAPDDRISLLEVMPGAFLSSIGLDYMTVKRYKSNLDVRDDVIRALTAYTRKAMATTNLEQYRPGCRANDDCLDAVVAAVAAAVWAQDCSRFRHPTDAERAKAQLEGWIYAPLPA